MDERLHELRRREHRRRRKGRSDWGPTVLGLLFVAGVLGALYLIYASATGDVESSEAPITVSVVEGDTLESVADKLKDAGVINSASLFELEARVSDQSTQIKPGKYRFRPGTDAEKILASMTAGGRVPLFSVIIPEGQTVEQTAATVADQSKIPAQEFEAAARKTEYGYAFLENPEIKTTEGFLFPKKYEFEQGTTASQVVNRLLEQYLLETQSLDFGAARGRRGLTEYEVLTIASLVEREAAANPRERRLVASVIYNRLRKDMPLQIDATIQYARGEPKEDLSLSDLKVKSPYNTYENPGLPPGPICSPGRDSLEAALNPAETNYLYYVLKADGQGHFFTNDYDEFLKAKAEAGR